MRISQTPFTRIRSTITLFYILASVLVQAQVTRYDVVSEWKKDELILVNVTTHPVTRFNSTQKMLKVASQPFKFVIFCQATTEACSKMEKGLNSAAARISSVITIRSTINVRVTVESFCDGVMDASCARNGVLAQTSTASHFIHNPDKTPINEAPESESMYPQALYKQLPINPVPVYNEWDIYASFNTDIPYWYSQDDVDIRSKQVDFELIACHEILHGLGFDNSWVDWSSMFGSQGMDYNAFLPLVTLGKTSASPQVIALSWSKQRIYDRFLYDGESKRQLNEVLVDLKSRIQVNGQPFKTLTEQIKSDPIAYEITTSLMKSATSGQLFFTIFRGGVRVNIPVFAPPKFSMGSSVGHLDLPSFQKTPDFLMVPYVTPFQGRTLDTVINSNRRQGQTFGIFGAVSLAMMKTMGWESEFEPDMKMFATGQYSIGASSDANSITSAATLFIMGISALVLSMAA